MDLDLDDPPVLYRMFAEPVETFPDRAARDPERPGSEVSFVPGELCACIDGFSLHARVRVPPGERDRLERLCR